MENTAEKKNREPRIIDVSVISKQRGNRDLSFFSAELFSIGDIIEVPIRSTTKLACVTNIRTLSEMKSQLKAAAFALKKITGTKKVHSLLTSQFTKALLATSKETLIPLGTLITASLPQRILETLPSIKQIEHTVQQAMEPTAIQTEDQERYSYYRRIIRESFAKQQSVLCIVPTKSDTERVTQELSRGIEQYTHTLSSDIKKTELPKLWKNISKEKHCVLLVATGRFMSVPRNDIGIVIIEHEAHSGFKQITAPYLDYRVLAQNFAQALGAVIVRGDIFLQLQTIQDVEQHMYVTPMPLQQRFLSTASHKLVQMQLEKDKEAAPTASISNEALEILQKTKRDSERTIIFANRVGLSGIAVCDDCGSQVLCSHCNSPVALHESKSKQRLFVCHNCGEKRQAEDACSTCGGWRITLLGITTGKIQEDIKELLSDIKTIVLDSEHASTLGKQQKIIKEFIESPGSVLIATEMIIPHLHGLDIDNTIIASVDPLFAIPDFKIDERIVRTLLELRVHTQRNFLIQTRNANTKIFEYILRGNIQEFVEKTLDTRRKLGYPPFMKLIHIQVTDKKTNAFKTLEELSKKYPDQLQVFPTFTTQKGGLVRMNAILKIKPTDWPNTEIIKDLIDLPVQAIFDLNPESIV